MDQFDDRTPIYLQIADRIRTSILLGELTEDDQIMSTTQYATTYRINPATAGKAMNLLVEEGLIYKRRGLGMFVAAGAREQLIAAHRSAFFTDRLDPVVAEGDALGITRESMVERIVGGKK